MARNLSVAAGMALTIAIAMPTIAYGQRAGAELRLNQLQWIGTHNSYHIEPSPNEAFPDLAYSHQPLPEQLAMGLRFFELDIQTPAKRRGTSATSELEVFHVVGIDEGTHCRAFRLCLQQIGDFVEENPHAGPVFVQLELKLQKGVRGQQIANTLMAVNAEIVQTIGRAGLLVPSDIADKPTSLRSSVQSGGWPLASQASSKIIFILNSSDRVTEIYLRMLRADFRKVMFPALEDRTDPRAAVINTFDLSSDIACQASQSGQLVITYADWRTTAARNNDTSQRDAAFKSGAQLIATDFPVPDLRKSSYQVSFSDGLVSTSNPYLRKRQTCRSD
jgi:Phosphoinositide phospholipase C, Ca2+-dependent